MGKCISTRRMMRKEMRVGRIPMIAHRLRKSPRKSQWKLSLRFRVKRLLKCWWMLWNLSHRLVKERKLSLRQLLLFLKRLKRTKKIILMQNSLLKPRNLQVKPWERRKRRQLLKNQRTRWLDFSIPMGKALICRLLKTATYNICSSNMQSNRIWKQWKSFKLCMRLRRFRSSGKENMPR